MGVGLGGRGRAGAAAVCAVGVLLGAAAGASASAGPWDPLARQEVEPDTLYLLDAAVEPSLPAGDGGLLAANARSGGLLWDPTSTIVPVAGRYRTGLQSNGGVYASAWMPAPDLLPGGEFTVEAWFKQTLRRWSVENRTLLRIGDAADSSYVRLYVAGGNIVLELVHQQRAAGPVSAQIVHPIVPEIFPGTWVNLAFTLHDGVLRLYRNGVAVGETAVEPPRLYADTANDDGLILLGNKDGLSAGGFVISDLRVSRHARVPGETPPATAQNVLSVDTNSRTGDVVNRRLVGVLHSLSHLASFSPVDESLAIGTVRVIRTDKMLTATPIVAGPPDATHPSAGVSGQYSYDWQVVDRTLDYFQSVGVEPVISIDSTPQLLGGSIAPFTGDTLTSSLVWRSAFARDVPNDFAAFAAMARDLVHHIVVERDDDVRYFSLWNEPDSGSFWTGTRDDYLRLYQAVAPAVKSVDPSLKIGGAETSRWDPAWIEALIRHAGTNALPLDFVAWHSYDGSVAGIARARAMVDYWAGLYGVARPELAIGEFAWNHGNAPISGVPPWGNYNYYLNDWNPAWMAASWIEMQRAGVAYSIGRAVTDVGQRSFLANGFIGPNGPWATLNAAYLWRDLAPNVVASTYSGRPGIFTLASTADDGRITILVSNLKYRHQVPDDPLVVRLPGVSRGRAITHYVIDKLHSNRFTAGEDHGELETVAPPAWTVDGELEISLRPRSVHMLELKAGPTVTDLVTTLLPAEFGQAVEALATVTGLATPYGSVEFSIDGAAVATVPLDAGGVARLALPVLSVGDHSVGARFLGNADFAPSGAVPVAQGVILATTTTRIEGPPSAGTVPYGTPLEFVVTVDAPVSAQTPVGQVQLTVGGADFGAPVELDSSGIARFTPLLPVGTNAVAARFVGSTGFATSSAPVPVSQAVVRAGTTTVLEAAATSFHNTTLTLTARVSPVAPSTADATGTVDFVVDGIARPSGAIVGGVATLTVSPPLAIGAHTISAAYAGVETHEPSGAPAVTHEVRQNSTISLTAEDLNGKGTKARSRATVTDLRGGIPAGNVDFYVDGVFGKRVSLDKKGIATWTDDLVPGPRVITARYLGNTGTGVDPVASAPVTVVVVAGS